TRSTARQLEVSVSSLNRHNGRERPEFLAILDVAVESITHFRGVWRGQNTAVPERTRSKFERAVHPPNDSACKQIVRGPLDQFRIAEFITRLAIFARQLRQRRSVYGRSPKRMVRDLTIRITEVNPVGIQSGAERAAGITGRRRNE